MVKQLASFVFRSYLIPTNKQSTPAHTQPLKYDTFERLARGCGWLCGGWRRAHNNRLLGWTAMLTLALGVLRCCLGVHHWTSRAAARAGFDRVGGVCGRVQTIFLSKYILFCDLARTVGAAASRELSHLAGLSGPRSLLSDSLSDRASFSCPSPMPKPPAARAACPLTRHPFPRPGLVRRTCPCWLVVSNRPGGAGLL